MDPEEEKRIIAVKLYLKGEKRTNICKDLNRSKGWLSKWVNRYKTGKEDWYKSHSRAPKNPGKKIKDEIENAVINVRKSLMDGDRHESKYLGVGADAIQYRMHKLGFPDDETPSVSTITRIVKKHKLKINKRERYKRVKSKKRYTILNPTRINEMHQIDFVGPRFIKGYGAISSLNLIDVVSNQVHIEQNNSKSMDTVIAFLIRYWNNNAIPRYLQVDNGMNFIGDFIHPRKFSRFIRLCLYVGVEAVFITPRSPWMNGSIENFNKWFDEKFWVKEIFVDLEDMRIKSTYFVDQYNDLSIWKKRNKELEQIEPIRMLKETVEINLNKLPLIEGKVHFIRRVDNDGEINVLNETFGIGKEFISEYVWATICLRKQRLEVYYRGQDHDVAKLIKEFDYDVIEKIKPLGDDIWNIR